MLRFFVAFMLLVPVAVGAATFEREYSIHVQSIWSGYTVLGLCADTDGSLVIAGGRGLTPQTMKAFLLRLDPAGNVVFLREYPFSEAGGVTPSGDGGYFVAGHRSFNDDPLVFKTNAAGNVLWGTSLDIGYAEQGFWGITATADGGCVASGIYTVRLNAAGTALWVKYHGVVGFGCGPDGAGNTVVGGIGPDGVPRANYNLGLSKVDPDGHPLWSRAYGTGDNETGFCFTRLVGGGYILSGQIAGVPGPTRAHLIKANEDGALAWGRQYVRAGGMSTAHGIVATKDGGAVFTGGFAGTVGLVRIGGDGVVQWSRAFRPGTGYPLIAVPGGGYALAGVNATGDLMVVRTDENGVTACAQSMPLTVQTNPTVQASLPQDFSFTLTPRFETPGSELANVEVFTSCGLVPLALEAFEVAGSDAALEVRWRLSGSLDAGELELQRADAADREWRKCTAAWAVESGWTLARDADVEPGRLYTYRLVLKSADGALQLLGEASGRPARPGTSLVCTPGSPARRDVRIEYTLPQSGRVRIDVLDVRGRVVAALDQGARDAGTHESLWTGASAAGPAAGGVYFVRLRAGAVTLGRRVVLLH